MQTQQDEKLPMTNDEVYASYKNAKNQKQQVRILAELNDCGEEEIRDILRTYGVIFRGRPKIEKSETEKPSEVPTMPLSVYGALTEELTRITRQIEELAIRYDEISRYIKSEKGVVS